MQPRAADLVFVLLVLDLGIVAETVTADGLEHAQAPVLPDGTPLSALLAITALASVCNNLPVVLVLATSSGAGRAARDSTDL